MSISECDPNTPLLAKPNYRSSSVKPSMRSSRSRITLVGYDADLEPKIDVSYGKANIIKDLNWFDHLLGVCCMSRRSKLKTVQTRVSESAPGPKDRQANRDSPWVLPVFVLSTKRDEYRHFVPKEAKCTIDTGNLQGNIVSRAFLVDVLGHSEADFQKLTKEEEDGGTGITGHRLIPEGAIYLTWYHSNSTRVFRNMRFLISEHPMYDLIIGAYSIREHNILDVPNLVDGPGTINLEEGPRNRVLDKLFQDQLQAQVTFDSKEQEAYDKDDDSPQMEARLESLKKTYETERKKWVDELRRVYELEIQKPRSPWSAQQLRDLFKGKTGTELNDVLVIPDPLHRQ